MGPQKLERLDQRKDAIKAALTAALSTRTIKASLLPYDQHSAAELKAGVVMLIADKEAGYSRQPGMIGTEGTTDLMLVCHLKVDESDTAKQGAAVDAAEIALAEEIKSFVRTGVAGVSLYLDSIQLSRQLEAPYGWLVAKLSAAPPQSTTH